jgi:protein HOOK3
MFKTFLCCCAILSNSGFYRQKSEDNLIAAENEVERQSNTVVDLTQKNEDLQSLADSAARLKDQVDE